MSLILIRYGELALKSHKVRRRFEEQLIEEVSRRFDRLGLDWMIEREQGRIFLHCSETNLKKAIFVLQHVPGIFSVSPVRDFEIVDGMETVVSQATDFAKGYLSPGQTFVVRARRAGSHAFTSQEAAALSGERILDTIPDLKVIMKGADVTIFLEIRGRRGFLFTEQFRGMGGLPQGSQGKVALLLSGPHSQAAGYLIMKRGCAVVPIHFKGSDDEDTAAGADPEAEEAYKELRQFDPRMELIIVGPGTETGMEAHPDTRVEPRAVYELMTEHNGQAVVTGHRFDNFDPSFKVRNEPVFFPLVGLPDERINEILEDMKDYYRTTTAYQSELEGGS